MSDSTITTAPTATGPRRTLPCAADPRAMRRAVEDIVDTALDRVSALELERMLSELRWATATVRLSRPCGTRR